MFIFGFFSAITGEHPEVSYVFFGGRWGEFVNILNLKEKSKRKREKERKGKRKKKEKNIIKIKNIFFF